MANKTISRKRVQEILREARNKMNDGGKHWLKRTFRKDVAGVGMCYCAVGAINSVAMTGEERNAAYLALANKGLEKMFQMFMMQRIQLLISMTKKQLNGKMLTRHSARL